MNINKWIESTKTEKQTNSLVEKVVRGLEFCSWYMFFTQLGTCTAQSERVTSVRHFFGPGLSLVLFLDMLFLKITIFNWLVATIWVRLFSRMGLLYPKIYFEHSFILHTSDCAVKVPNIDCCCFTCYFFCWFLLLFFCCLLLLHLVVLMFIIVAFYCFICCYRVTKRQQISRIKHSYIMKTYVWFMIKIQKSLENLKS